MYDDQHAMDLVTRAKEFAVKAHRRIGHRRKYTRLPYTTHLQNVVALVASVTEDPEMLAAAWLHDVVEDTPATLEDVEKSFGKGVADMVASLTDVSRPSDGNRAQRKELDRKHLAQAGAGAKTVKLADLIDNCRDICRNDERFAKQYLKEMDALLEVLEEGDKDLYRMAGEIHDECSRRIGVHPLEEERPVDALPGILGSARVPPHLIRLFTDSFIAQDIADPLRSFDREKRCAEVLTIMEQNGIDVISVRGEGIVKGYLRRIDLGRGNCGDHLRQFRSGQVLDGEDSLTEVIHALTLYEYTFVSMLGDVTGLISRGCLNKPVARMWLFGMVTMTEMELGRLIGDYFSGESWIELVSPGRLEKARALQEERARRNQHCGLIECLQLSDKGQILMEKREMLEFFGFESKKTAKRIVKEFESLRNNLAHAQDIVTHDWAAIARIATRLAEAASLRRM